VTCLDFPFGGFKATPESFDCALRIPSSSILSKSWVCLSQDFLGTLKSFVAYLIPKAIGFSRYVAKLWSLHHIPGYRIS
jgi:hypothetical protein